MQFDAKKELAAFYERHFDKLVDRCLDASSKKFRYSPLNTLPIDERRQWAMASFREIIRIMLSDDSQDEGGLGGVARVYFPRVSELTGSSLFGAADVIDSCECALLPDEGILPLLWEDYSNDREQLLALVMEFRRAQNNITKLQVRYQVEDYERYLDVVKKLAINEERSQLESEIYRHFHLALHTLKEKTSELYAAVGSGASREMIATEVTQIKMMEADLLSEVFRMSPEIDTERNEASRQTANGSFAEELQRCGLTERECEVVGLVARGYSNKRIAEKLNLAESTIKNNLSSILLKLNCESRSQIVVFAAEHGYFNEPYNG